MLFLNNDPRVHLSLTPITPLSLPLLPSASHKNHNNFLNSKVYFKKILFQCILNSKTCSLISIFLKLELILQFSSLFPKKVVTTFLVNPTSESVLDLERCVVSVLYWRKFFRDSVLLHMEMGAITQLIQAYQGLWGQECMNSLDKAN